MLFVAIVCERKCTSRGWSYYFCLASLRSQLLKRMSLRFSLFWHLTSYPAVLICIAVILLALFAVHKMYAKAIIYFEKVLSLDKGLVVLTIPLRTQCLSNMREMSD
jgi:hypothetical protein